MEDDSKWQLETDRLARLLSIGEDHELPDDPASVDELTAELLRKRLASPLPLAPASATEVVLCWSSAGSPATARSVGEVLLDPSTDVAVLQRIKSWGKKLADRQRDRPNRSPEYAAGLTIYYAAIASALAFHDERITDYGFGQLAEALQRLIDQPWLSPAVSDLFAKAGRICQERTG